MIRWGPSSQRRLPTQVSAQQVPLLRDPCSPRAFLPSLPSSHAQGAGTVQLLYDPRPHGWAEATGPVRLQPRTHTSRRARGPQRPASQAGCQRHSRQCLLVLLPARWSCGDARRDPTLGRHSRHPPRTGLTSVSRPSGPGERALGVNKPWDKHSASRSPWAQPR